MVRCGYEAFALRALMGATMETTGHVLRAQGQLSVPRVINSPMAAIVEGRRGQGMTGLMRGYKDWR